ncbi:MAG: DedA family protein [Planctomycetes bacterium]|nr:DedA family protein [Planctomycetota bacterium]
MEWIVKPILAFVTSYGYVAVFCILVACGLGLPIPEEFTLVASGYVAHLRKTRWQWMALDCTVAILVGDLVTYYIGHHYGLRVFRSRFFRRLLTETRLAKVRSWYAKYGSWTVFFSRFVAGVRFCSYFTAGTMGVNLFWFIFMDLLGALVSVPISVWAGHWLASGGIEEAVRYVRRLNRSIFLVVSLLASILALCMLIRERRKRQALETALRAALASNPNAGAGTGAVCADPAPPAASSPSGLAAEAPDRP